MIYMATTKNTVQKEKIKEKEHLSSNVYKI